MLSTKVAEIAIPELIVLITVHVSEDLKHLVTLKPKSDFLKHVCEVGESHIALGSDIKRSENCRNFSKFLD